MAWIITILFVFWGIPLLTILAIGIACLLSERMRAATASLLGLNTGSPTAARVRNRVKR